MVASSLRASANSFGSEEVSRRLGVLWRFFTSQQRSFKRHLLASFTTFHFLFFLPVFFSPKLKGIIKIKERNACGFLKFSFKLCEHHLKIIHECVRGGKKAANSRTPARNGSNNALCVGDFFDQI